MLENNLYTVVSKNTSDENLQVNIALNAEHFIYKSHFPGNPITPGVCLLQIVLEQLNNHFKKSFRLVRAKNIKYLKIIQPQVNNQIEFHIKYKIENDLVMADISIQSGETIFTKISGTYKG